MVGAYHKVLPVKLCLMDGFLIWFSLFICSFIEKEWRWAEDYWQVSVLTLVLFYLIASLTDLYGVWRGTQLGREFTRLLCSWFGCFMILILMASAFKTTVVYSRLVFFSWALVAPCLLCLWHLYLHRNPSLVTFGKHDLTRVVIAGVDEDSLKVAHTIQNSTNTKFEVMGFYDDDPQSSISLLKEQGFRHLGSLNDLEKDAQVGSYHLAYINSRKYMSVDMASLMRRLSDSTVSVYLLLNKRISPFSFEPHIHIFDGHQAVSLYETPFKGWQMRMKRAEDIVLSIVILTIIALPMLLIALLVKLTSPGPVIYRQRRYGMGGRPFTMYKFRSMTVTEEGTGVIQAEKGDARVTKLGVYLRRHSLDEFPQFINVLLGNMSIVGPRPHATIHNEIYRKKILGYMLRHKVKPGITGLAQVSGCRGQTDTKNKMENRIAYDLEYIKQWSLWLDLKIVFVTIFKGFNDPDAF